MSYHFNCCDFTWRILGTVVRLKQNFVSENPIIHINHKTILGWIQVDFFLSFTPLSLLQILTQLTFVCDPKSSFFGWSSETTCLFLPTQIQPLGLQQVGYNLLDFVSTEKNGQYQLKYAAQV